MELTLENPKADVTSKLLLHWVNSYEIHTQRFLFAQQESSEHRTLLLVHWYSTVIQKSMDVLFLHTKYPCCYPRVATLQLIDGICTRVLVQLLSHYSIVLYTGFVTLQ